MSSAAKAWISEVVDMAILTRNNRKKIKVAVIALVCLFSLWQGWPQRAAEFASETLDVISEFAPPGESSSLASQKAEFVGDGNLSVHFIDVGNADSTLIICDGEAALIDAGENEDGETVVNYLKDQGVTGLKYAVGTHPHSDHIGGLDTVLHDIPTETTLLPEKTHTTKTYQDVLTAINKTGSRLMIPAVGDKLSLGGATLTVLSPDRVWDDLNNNSIVLYLEYGEDSFLFAGDAETAAEDVMLDTGTVPEADVLKVGHHGSSTSTGYRWLWTIMPDYCVIPCGTGNKYGHPHEEVMSRLSDHSKVNGTTVYRSDENGTIVAFSDGSGNIRFETERGEGWAFFPAAQR